MYRKTPTAPAGDIAPTASVQKVPLALAFWERTAPILIADGRLTADRVDAFAILCRLHAEIEQLADQVAAEGWITATEKGQAASPVAKLLRDSRRDFVTLARRRRRRRGGPGPPQPLDPRHLSRGRRPTRRNGPSTCPGISGTRRPQPRRSSSSRRSAATPTSAAASRSGST